MASHGGPRISVEEYRRREEAAPYRSEFVDGEVFALLGATRNHSLIGVNLVSQLHQLLRSAPAFVFGVDFRVWISEARVETYPDGSVSWGDPEVTPGNGHAYTNPLVIWEILSPATEEYDRGIKFAAYKKLASLRQYLLVAQDEPMVESHWLGDDGQWSVVETRGLTGTVELPALGCSIPMRQIYFRVFDGEEWDTATPRVTRLSVEEYRERQRAAATESQYGGDEVLDADSGAREHAVILANVSRVLGNALEGKGCCVTTSDVRVFIPAHQNRRDGVLDPTVVIEVFSPSTERFDRGGGFAAYRTLASLQQYVLVSQEEARVESFIRGAEGTWTLRETIGLEGTVEFEPVQCRIAMSDIYANVFPEESTDA